MGIVSVSLKGYHLIVQLCNNINVDLYLGITGALRPLISHIYKLYVLRISSKTQCAVLPSRLLYLLFHADERRTICFYY